MSIDSEVQDLISKLNRKCKNKISKSIKKKQFLGLGRFSFFDDKSFLVNYGLTIKDNKIVIYTQLSCPYFSTHAPEIPGSLDSYKIRFNHPIHELLYFPTLKSIKNALDFRLQ